MYEKWNEIQTKDTAWFERHATGLTAEVTKMMARIQSCDINKHDEGVLSSHVSIALQRVVPIILKQQVEIGMSSINSLYKTNLGFVSM